MENKKRVICTNDLTEGLTKDKVYEVEQIHYGQTVYYDVIDDNGKITMHNANDFVNTKQVVINCEISDSCEGTDEMNICRKCWKDATKGVKFKDTSNKADENEMSRRTWSKGLFNITYEKPVITVFREEDNKPINNMNDVMYFYYDIIVQDGDKVIFNSHTHDFPKVQHLHLYIDEIINISEGDMFLYNDYKDGEFHRKTLYNFITLEDSFNMDAEYFYKIEREIVYVRQGEDKECKRYEEFTLTIGQNKCNKEGFSNGEDYGKAVFIKYLTRDDLLRLKQISLDFCKDAIDEYNQRHQF